MSNQLQEIQAIADTWRQDVCASRRIFKKQVEHEQVKEVGRLSRNMRNNSRNVKNSRQKERKKGTTGCRNPPNLCKKGYSNSSS